MKTTYCERNRTSRVGLLTVFALAVLSSSATAQTPARTISRATAMVTPGQQKIISTAHYQASLDLICNGGNDCIGEFPIAAANTQINISRINCYFPATPGSRYRYGEVRLLGPGTPTSGPKLTWRLPVAFTSDDGINLINSGVGLQVLAGQYLYVTLRIIATTGHVGTGMAANCTIDGTQNQVE